MLSNLVRQALKEKNAPVFRNGIMLLERRPGESPTTLEWVNRIRDEE